MRLDRLIIHRQNKSCKGFLEKESSTLFRPPKKLNPAQPHKHKKRPNTQNHWQTARPRHIIHCDRTVMDHLLQYPQTTQRHSLPPIGRNVLQKPPRGNPTHFTNLSMAKLYKISHQNFSKQLKKNIKQAKIVSRSDR